MKNKDNGNYRYHNNFFWADSSIPKHNRISQCPTGYEGYKKSCYKFGVDSTTFHDAQRLCQQENGHLASITSVFEYGFVRGFSANSNLSSYCLGLHLSKVRFSF